MLCYTAVRTEVWMHLRINQINIARTISHPSVVPTLWPPGSPVADPEAPIMPLVTCPVFTERVYDYWGLSGECHKQLSKEICFAAYGNLFRHLQIYKTLILTDHITSEPYTVQTSQLYST